MNNNLQDILINISSGKNGMNKLYFTNKTEYIFVNGIKIKSSFVNMNSFEMHYYFDNQNTNLNKLSINANYSDVNKFKINGNYLKYGNEKIYLNYIPDHFTANLLVQIKNHEIVPLIEKDQIETIPYSIKEEVENLQQKISFWKRYQNLFLLLIVMFSFLIFTLSYYGLMTLYK